MIRRYITLADPQQRGIAVVALDVHLLRIAISTTSVAPFSTAWPARNSAVGPAAQLLFTLTIGMPLMPTGYSARWPQVEAPDT